MLTVHRRKPVKGPRGKNGYLDRKLVYPCASLVPIETSSNDLARRVFIQSLLEMLERCQSFALRRVFIKCHIGLVLKGFRPPEEPAKSTKSVP